MTKGAIDMKKILVVDNHPVVLKYMMNLLEKEGHQVKTAKDGLAAIDILEAYVPDIIFCDMIMPRIDGEKLCRIVRSTPALKEVLFVIVSGVASETKIDFRGFGADLCIAKGPFNIMSEHVLNVLARPKREILFDRAGEILGLESLQPRSVAKELLCSKRHFEVILNHMSEGILEITSDWRIVDVNLSGVSLLGMSEERILGGNFVDLFHETCKQKVREVIGEMDDLPRQIDEDFPMLLNGKQVSLHILPIRDEKRLLYIVIMADMSAKKVAAARIRQAQQMEAVSKLAGGIAHEFNNALMAVSGNLELLGMALPADERAKKYLSRVGSATDRMKNLTGQLIAYARGGKYDTRPVSPLELIRGSIDKTKKNVGASIGMETDFSEGVHDIEVDRTQMSLVVSALIMNASEAMEDGGTIRITLKNMLIDGEFAMSHGLIEPGQHVCLIVEDDGKGMDEEMRERIFDPFFTTGFRGRGIGMAAVYGIVGNHAGSIEVDSEPGKGTTVTIYLPAVKLG